MAIKTLKLDQNLMSADLERSGLTLADAEMLGMRLLTGAETQQLSDIFKPLPALYIPYYNPMDSTKPLSILPKWPPFYRIRYLVEPNGFNKVAESKPLRYMQPRGSGVCAYFPRGSVDWRVIIGDSTTPIIITEGEKKAARSCLSGHPTIGLGGVYSFRSAGLGLTLLPELECVVWVQRTVYIIFDSDMRINPNICAALMCLAEELMLRGAMPHLVMLPDLYGDGCKTGLDDYLVAGHQLSAVLQHAEPLTLARSLWALNKKVVYIRNPGLIIERNGGARISAGTFKEHLYSAENYAERKLNADGSVSLKRTSAASAWLKWPLRAEATRLTYCPGKPECMDTVEGIQYNVWSGWGVVPDKGNVEPFKQLIDHLFEGSSKDCKEWFLRWLAYPLQHPGTKLFTAVVMFGTRHGTGKSLIGLTMGQIYGSNFSEISQADLESGFNEWAIGKQFVLGDDVTGSDRRAHADQLKKMITQKELRVNQKFVPTYVVPDCLNYYFTSNQPDAFFLEDDDRRYFVHEVTQAPLQQEFYRSYATWLSCGGAGYLFDYLLNLSLGDFDPTAPALKTAARDNMVLDVKSDLGGWVARLLKDPNNMLRMGELTLQSDLYTNKQLLALYDPTNRTNTTANGLGRELRRAGVQHVLRGAQVRTEDGLDRYYILRNIDKWLAATLTDVKKHLAEQQSAEQKLPKY